MATPLVSVLMTAWNREKFIAEAIESVLGSRFTDFELIVVDDGSRDRTVEIAQRYVSDARVRVFVNEKNVGDYPNRNRAAAKAQGRYLKYLDSDDVLYAHGLEVMIDMMEKSPEAAFGIERPSSRLGPFVTASPVDAYREHFLGEGLFGCGPSGSIIRAEAFRTVGGFREMRMVGDMDLWLRLSARYPMVKIVYGLVWWRCHDMQEVASQTAATIGAELRVALEALQTETCPLSVAEKQEALRRVRWRFARRVLRHGLREGQIKLAAEIFRGSGLSAAQLLAGLLPLNATRPA